MFACFQPIKIIGDHPEAGRAGTVRQDVRAIITDVTEAGAPITAEVVAVQLDGDDAPQDVPVGNVSGLF